MSLRQFILAAAVSGATLAAAASASAATVLDFSSSNVGVAQTIDLNGYVPGGTTTVDPNLSGALTVTLLSVTNNNVWTFSYSLTNTSTEQSRIGALGWDIEELNGTTKLTNAFTGNIVTGSKIGSGAYYTNSTSGKNMPEIGKLDFCMNSSNGSSCGGGANGGPTWAQSPAVPTPATGEFSLTFPTKQGRNTIPTPTELEFSSFAAHYQSLAKGDSTVGVGVDPPTVSAVPEPATWTLMLLSFFGLGATLRRRRSQGLAQAVAG